ncbi:MAG TPA: glycosyltransferase family 2 protein [Thermoanaerobaculia bacterium]|jgi:glycosyltransferase involved in cell wall biosynthesis|nr:glycosyltransferase family 2 protein [Thermoanaerobaculia bacterium]
MAPSSAAAPPVPISAEGSSPELSLVVPVYNEDENLAPLVAEIAAVLEPAGRTYELLLVDDGSTDASPSVMAGLAAADARIRVIRLKRNSGQSAALDAGFRFARGEVVVTLDADLQNDPADIPRMLAELSRADVVCGIRANRRDSWVRRVSSRVANGVRNRLTHEHVTDVGCTLRVCRRELLVDLPMFTGLHRFLPTLLKMQGGTVVEIPVNHRPRLHGVAKYGIGNRLWRALADLFAVRWMQKRWIDRRLAEEIHVERR